MARFLEKLRKVFPTKSLALNIALGLVVVLVFMAGAAEYTSRPNFCTTCHYMEPFYESWQTSSHADVTCTECHFPPGFAGTVRGKVEGLVQVANYVTRSYTRRKPWAEIDDASCLQSGCHDTRLLQDSVQFQNVTFAHQPHLTELRRGKTLRCTSCHSQIVQGEHMVVTETSCFLCHFKKSSEISLASYQELSDCQTCHTQPPLAQEGQPAPRYDHSQVIQRDIACTQCHNQTVVGDGAVPTDACFGCHFEPEHLDRIEDTDFVHDKHIRENKIECTQCHLRIEHKVQRLTVENELDCTTCHERTHREQLLLFTGSIEEAGVEGVANPMFEAGLDCASCHVFHEQLIGQGSVLEAGPQSCESCHGEGYNRLLGLWQEGFANKLSTFEQAIRRVESGLQSASSTTASEVQPVVQQAKNGLHVVEVGRAVHNVAYADRILQAGMQNLRRVVQQANLAVSLPEFEASTVPGECANCHTGIETVSASFQGRTFSHETHVLNQELACNTCHSNTQEHGELIINAASCNSCHHRGEADELNCAGCHETAAAIYAGTFLQKASPDIMFDAGIECIDCHVPDDQVVMPDAQICVDCHDEDYQEMGEEWQADIQSMLEEVKALLEQVRTPAQRNTAAYRQARQVVQGIEDGGARGMHNYDLTLDVLDETKTALENLLAGT